MAISDDLAVVGAPRDNEHGEDSGSVYVYERTGSGGWIEAQKLTAGNDAQPGDRFGISVAIDGTTIVVGAFLDDEAGQNSVGIAYVFEPGDNQDWVLVDELSPGDGHAAFLFGTSVSINGDTIVVGAPFSEHNESMTGAAYVFARQPNSTNWQQVDKLTASDADLLDEFGTSVAIQADTIVVGANRDG